MHLQLPRSRPVMNSYSPAFWQDRSVLVTGCTGFLGANLTRTLVDAGARVTGLVRDHVHDGVLARSGLLARINIVYGDLSKIQTLQRAIGEYEVESVLDRKSTRLNSSHSQI